MRTIEDFETALLALLGKPTRLRPFVCEGNPLECQAFIVGLNPATASAVDFWAFWNSDFGFDRAAWFDAYKEERRHRPLKPGKTRRNVVSNARRVIDWVLEGANPVRCLETNIYAAPTEQAVDLKSEQRITAPFDFLLASIKPRVILAHGADAKRHIGTKHLSAQIRCVEHFSRGWSQNSARELGRQIRSTLSGRGHR